MTDNTKKGRNSFSLSKDLQGNTLLSALTEGGLFGWLSCIFMGLGNIKAGQWLKGILFFISQVAFTAFMLSPRGGIYSISLLPSLGSSEQGKVWNEDKGIFEYTAGDRSQLILLYGIAALCVTVAFIFLWRASVISGCRALKEKRMGLYPKTFREDIKSLFNENIHSLLMTPPTATLLVFTVLPLIYMMSMAFTDFSREGDKLVLFDWVGFDNFIAVFSRNSVVGRQFWSVLLWTVVWAFFATFLNFLFGTFVAMLINRPGIRLRGLWRTILATTIAVPQFVSLMVVRSMVQPEGIINRMLLNGGLIAERLPFLTESTWARVLVIVVNLWIGIPYTILQVTGVLNNIPKEQYDAAKVDGCTPYKTFMNVTLPYMMFVLTPYLITQFTGNINNFNVIYLLTRGEPVTVGNTAGATDLLITWLYKLSVDQQKYNLAAVIGILTFATLSVVALITYRSTGSYKNEEGFK
ncbi:MAG: sugar ABC transporter permease [Ruminococcaceae bacterium]|nr:sugar ABC transporter permease [Oscillospiraceae bacterium]